MSLRWLLAVALATLGLLLPTAAHAASPNALVFGANDNGVEGDNVAETLRELGVPTDRSARLPSDLSAYTSIWYIEAYSGLTSEEQTAIADYVSGGGRVYLTGERPCCEGLNASITNVLRAVLKDGDVQVGGLGDINGPFAFNPDVTDFVARIPNLLVDFLPDSPGGMAGIGGVSAANVFASNGTTPVGAVWAEKDTKSGAGRVALLMDIDWLKKASRVPIIENIENFLERGGLCSNGGHHEGFVWTGPAPTNSPADCSTLLTPADIRWKAGSDAGPVTLTADAQGLTATCTSDVVAGATELRCGLRDAAQNASLRITATDAKGSTVRRYRVRPMNDPRNVPPGQAADSKWWNWPDADDDGLPDHWESNGVWVKDRFLDLPGKGANSRHKDLFVHYDFQEGEELAEQVFDTMRDVFADAPLGNPDGKQGVTLHIERGASIPASIVGDFDLTKADLQRTQVYSGFANSPQFGGGGVPQIWKWLLNYDSGPGSVIGRAQIRGKAGWTAFPVNATEAALTVSALPGTAVNFAEASNATHELGHMLGLLHHGDRDEPVRDTKYKSVMSYSYSNYGLPSGLLGISRRIDYSRSRDDVHLDWQMGANAGQLQLVTGQRGEQPDFYAANNAEEIDTAFELPDEPTPEEAIRNADPSSLQAFTEQFSVGGTLKSPTIDEPAPVAVRNGETIDIPLRATDPLGGSLTFVIDHAPALGTASPTESGIRYTAPASGTGDDEIVVRALNASFGSRQVRLAVRVLPVPDPERADSPATNPAGGGGAGTGPVVTVTVPQVSIVRFTRLPGRADKRSRLGRLVLRSKDATSVRIHVVGRDLAGCRRRSTCGSRVLTRRTDKVRTGKATLVITVPGRRLKRGRYTVNVVPIGADGRRGRAVGRSLQVRSTR